MTAPDPTAGERACRYPCDCGQFHDEHCACMDGHALPAVAASTGTSEDVETRCIVGLSDAERDDWAEVLMRRRGREMDDESAYDNACRDVDALWHLVAAREAAARAEERERIARAIEDAAANAPYAPLANHWTGLAHAARIAREGLALTALQQLHS